MKLSEMTGPLDGVSPPLVILVHYFPLRTRTLLLRRSLLLSLIAAYHETDV